MEDGWSWWHFWTWEPLCMQICLWGWTRAKNKLPFGRLSVTILIIQMSLSPHLTHSIWQFHFLLILNMGPLNNYIFFTLIIKFTSGQGNAKLKVNLFQKHLFLPQLTHNITKYCSLNQFCTWKFQARNMSRTYCVHKLFWM